MNDKAGEEIAQNVIEMYDSLHQAIQRAGGTGAGFSPEKLKTMTVSQLIGELANNKIRFWYIGEDSKKKIK